MAVVNLKDSKLRIKFVTGVDLDGNDTFKTKTYSKIKSAAIDDDVIAVANSISGLQEHVAAGLVRVDEKEISEA